MTRYLIVRHKLLSGRNYPLISATRTFRQNVCSKRIAEGNSIVMLLRRMNEQPNKQPSSSESPLSGLSAIAPSSSPTRASDLSRLSSRPQRLDKWSEEFWQRAFQSKDRQQSLERIADLGDEDEEYLLRLAARQPFHRKPVTPPGGKSGLGVSRSADSSPQGGFAADVAPRGSERGPSRAAREFWRQSGDEGVDWGVKPHEIGLSLLLLLLFLNLNSNASNNCLAWNSDVKSNAREGRQACLPLRLQPPPF
jgi:hypothetical protein